MDPSGSPSFTGVGCLWALLTLWFVPYGIYVLTFLLIRNTRQNTTKDGVSDDAPALAPVHVG